MSPRSLIVFFAVIALIYADGKTTTNSSGSSSSSSSSEEVIVSEQMEIFANITTGTDGNGTNSTTGKAIGPMLVFEQQ
ncbi:hypothetical protein QR680_000966 [Steinernema hermaphroditum]|uniref:Uncharacterized protein n=1 Tax=Steinernema hermaphroditum TaxID=289476 RepID=A0AA39GWM8_9BILA|nr:hypothetical protein QR680_000966 [Steinernema hermaphroditum]